MSIKEAVSQIERVIRCALRDLCEKDHLTLAQEIDAAWLEVRKAALKAENRLNNAGATDKGIFIPESPDEVEFKRFTAEFKRSFAELAKRVSQNETDIMMLWNEAHREKENSGHEEN